MLKDLWPVSASYFRKFRLPAQNRFLIQCLLLMAAILIAPLSSYPAQAKRMALVIGNDLYKNVTPLKKAVNDATAIASTVKDLGFKPFLYQNLNRRSMNAALADFTSKIETNDEVLFFFSGHGIAVRGENYLLPTDVPSVTPGQERFITREAFSENEIIRTLQEQGVRVSILILDACRNNPFPRKGTRSIGRSVGLGRTTAPPQGTFVMYSAGVGQQALDRLSEDDPHPNSVYTRKLIPLLNEEGLQIVRVAKRLRSEVEALAKTAEGGAHKQYPSYYDELRGDFFFKPGERKKIGAGRDADDLLWKTIESSKNITDYEFYLKEHPKGRYSSIARLKIRRIKSQQENNTKTKKGGDEVLTSEDDLLWDRLQHARRSLEVEAYVHKFPEGRHFHEARALIRELRAKEYRDYQRAKALGEKKLAVITPKEDPNKIKTRSYQSGERFQDCRDCPKMVALPTGTYTMGWRNPDRKRHQYALPVRKMAINKQIAIGVYEITVGQYDAFIKATGHDAGNLCWTYEKGRGKHRRGRTYNKNGFKYGKNYPASCINWFDAKAYVKWLSNKVGGAKYRLPTEAEWEYAARSTGKKRWHYGDKESFLCQFSNHAAAESKVKWRNKSCRDGVLYHATVGYFKSNQWGVFDMYGNVGEWTEDCAHYDYKGAPQASDVPWTLVGGPNHGTCNDRMHRGGSWLQSGGTVSSGSRQFTKANERQVTIGIRVVKELE